MLVNLQNITMPNSKELDEALNKNFLNKEIFAEEIELLVLKTNMNYIDAIVQYCSDNNIDLDSVGKLISKPLKDKVKYDATELNYLKKTSRAKLPI